MIETLVRRRVGALVALIVLGAGACGDDGPTGPPGPRLDVVPSAGSGQFAEPGEALARPFEVLVRGLDDAEARPGVRVEWRVVEGRGATLSAGSSITDDVGRARSTLTLGPAPGLYRVEARAEGASGAPVTFWGRAVRTPELTGLPPGPVSPGDTIVLEGANFIPEVDETVVTFAGIRGRALESDGTTLRVRVPSCLPERSARVVVGFGDLTSDPGVVEVGGRGAALSLGVGETRTVEDPQALSCVRLPRESGARYLATVVSSSTLGAASFDYGLFLRIGSDGGSSGSPAADAPGPSGPRAGPGRGAQARWDRRLRKIEDAAVSAGGTRPRGPEGPAARAPRRGPGSVPAVGEIRRFNVLNVDGGFADVSATARVVTDRAVIYVDDEAPEGGFDSAELEAMGQEFDDPIHPTVTGIYGSESDVDGNDRVVILLTPAVNRLTERGSDDGFVGGFFFGIDLLQDREGSNGGEVFYAVVPDPSGTFGDPRSKERVARVVPAILAHEFQHMVHFNERVLVRDAPSTEALWLSEALATSAEDVVADAFVERGAAARAWEFREGNYIRARDYLRDPGSVSLVVGSGSGSLEERGAGWLFLRYLRGRTGGTGILGRLTRTTRTGVANVTATTGVGWPELITSWAAALYLDELGLPVPASLTFAGFDLRSELARLEGTFPLDPPVRGGEDRLRQRSIPSSALDPIILAPTGPGGVAVNLADPRGGPPPAEASLRLHLVRVR